MVFIYFASQFTLTKETFSEGELELRVEKGDSRSYFLLSRNDYEFTSLHYQTVLQTYISKK